MWGEEKERRNVSRLLLSAMIDLLGSRLGMHMGEEKTRHVIGGGHT